MKYPAAAHIPTLLTAFILAVIAAGLFVPALAAPAPSPTTAPPNDIEQMFCNLVVLMTGRLGRAICSLAVIVVGISAMFGKMSLHIGMTMCLGIACLFGASSIVRAMGGGDEQCHYAQIATDNCVGTSDDLETYEECINGEDSDF